MSQLPPSPSLPELQKYVAETCRERGWDTSSDLETFLLFMEEVGEMAKEARKRRGLFSEAARAGGGDNLGAEMADVLSYLLDLANRWGVNLESAYLEKEARNQGRTWAVGESTAEG